MNSQDPVLRSVFGFDAPEDSPGFLLWQTTLTWQRLIKKDLEKHDISHMQFVIMATLLWFEEHHETPTQATISRLSKIDEMTVSKSLKKLTTLGYTSREESPEDTRAKNVHLTIQGKEFISKLIPIVEKIDASFFNILTPSEQEALLQIFNKLSKR